MCADLRVAIRQVAEMHLDERLEKSREALGKQIAVGQQKVSSAYNRLWAEMEAMREAQKKRAEEARLQAEKEGRPIDEGKKCMSIPERRSRGPGEVMMLMCGRKRESPST